MTHLSYQFEGGILDLSSEYNIVRSLGAGATSEVFEGIRHRENRPVALKCFLPLVSQNPEIRERIALEAETLAQLDHPNIVKLRRYFEINGTSGFELELVDGGDLNQWVKNYSYQLIEPKLFVLVEVARALGGAHEKNILHRDLKPENILISKAGKVKLTDFGLAKSLSRITVTKSGVLLGSLAYMAPEVINLSHSSEQSDLFSFGVIAFEILTGKLPWSGETPQSVIRQLSLGEFEEPKSLNPLISNSVNSLIKSCLDPEPEHRPPSVWHVEAELMATLKKSRILPWVKEMVSDSSLSTLATVLKSKHETLVSSLENSKTLLPEKVQALTELKILFPSDEKLNIYFEQITKKPEKKTLNLRMVLLLVLLVISSYAYIDLRPKPSSVHNISITPAHVPVAGSPVSHLVRNPEITRDGFASFLAPEHVQISVDNVLLSMSERKKLRLSSGLHKIRMEMPGFLPIENIVRIQPGKTAVIRAGEDKK